MKSYPLRVSLVITVVVLVAAGLVTTGAASVALLRGYLLERVDAQLIDALSGIQQEGRGPGPSRPMDSERDLPPREYYITISDASGANTVVISSPKKGGTPQIPAWSIAQVQAQGNQPFTVQSNAADWRVIVAPLRDGSGSIAVAVSLADVAETVGRLLLLQVVIGAIVLIAAAVIGYFLVRRTLRPLREVEEAAVNISKDVSLGDLSRRVPAGRAATETGQLALAFNTMVDRIEESFGAQQESEAQARASEERMRRFVADASHELRTPLTTIRGFAELYRQGAAADVDGVMNRIEGEAQRMGVLVEDLLMLARLDQQRPLLMAPVDVLAVVTEAVQAARVASPDWPIALKVNLAAGPPVVLGDATRLRQVLDNLLANAIRHSGEGARVLAGVRTPGDGTAVVTVADTGVGMDTGTVRRVFERFYRADESRSRDAGGTGLGLAIVRSLVVAHGGTVLAESELGVGTTFTVTLPLGSQGT